MSIQAGMYRQQLEWQLAVKYPIKWYCDHCFWGKACISPGYCSHGCYAGQKVELRPISDYLEELCYGV